MYIFICASLICEAGFLLISEKQGKNILYDIL